MINLLSRFTKYSVVLLGFLAVTLSHGQDDRAEDTSILDIDANGEVDALTDGLLLLRSMFGLTDDVLITGVVSSDATVSDANDIDSYITSIRGMTYGGLTGSQTGESVTELSDALVEDNSMYIGNDPSATTDAAEYNLAIGATALESITSGDNNTAVGHDTLSDNTEGYWNTATGAWALGLNTTGFWNTASGYAALYLNITGEKNTATGALALYSNTAGTDNTATGSVALYENTTGYGNAATGAGALYYNNTGIYNTASGVNALLSNTTGTYNTAIGYAADVASEDLTNATAIGNGASVSESNKIRLGDSNVVVIEGQVAFSASSDRRLKKDITNTKYGLKTILELVPVDYQLKSNDLFQVGFIAQDLKPILPEAITGIEGDLAKGETLGVTYTTLIPVLTKALQEQQALIDAQNKVIQQLQKDMLILKQK